MTRTALSHYPYDDCSLSFDKEASTILAVKFGGGLYPLRQERFFFFPPPRNVELLVQENAVVEYGS